MSQPRIRAQRGEERLLEAVLGIGLANGCDEKPMQLGGMVVDEALERRQSHTP